MRILVSPRTVLQPHRFAVDLPGRLLVNGEREQSCVLDVVDAREAYFTASISDYAGTRGRAIPVDRQPAARGFQTKARHLHTSSGESDSNRLGDRDEVVRTVVGKAAQATLFRRRPNA